MSFRENLQTVLQKYKIKFNKEKIDNLEIFHANLIKYNEKHNLTTIVDDNDAILKHYLDSLLPISLIKDNSKVIDIGCGGGFPSVPLKILNSNLNITAIDSVNKKITFVKSIKDTLNFNNFEAIHTRIEDLAHKIEYREKYDYVISRAVAPLNIILEYSAPFLKNNGHILSYKGSNYLEELEKSKNALNKLNCVVKKIEKYYIEELDAERCVIIIEKTKKIDKMYPRTKNKPRIQPL